MSVIEKTVKFVQGASVAAMITGGIVGEYADLRPNSPTPEISAPLSLTDKASAIANSIRKTIIPTSSEIRESIIWRENTDKEILVGDFSRGRIGVAGLYSLIAGFFVWTGSTLLRRII